MTLSACRVQLAVTQPYDKITPAMQERYYQASPYNLVRIILGKRLPADGDAENVYTRAAASFRDWRQTGILRRDPEPSLYLYSQTFPLPGDVPINCRERAWRPGVGRAAGLHWLSAGSRSIPRASCSGTSRPWPSPRPTAWTCCARPAPTSARFSCSTAGRARWMPCSIRRPPNQRHRGHRRVRRRASRLEDLRSFRHCRRAGTDAGSEADHRRRPSPL